MRILPGSSSSPFLASTTRSLDLASRRWAKSWVKTGGMCWVTTIGTGKPPGRAETTWVRASGPPVEMPMATTSTRPVGRAAVPVTPGAEACVGPPAPGTARRPGAVGGGAPPKAGRARAGAAGIRPVSDLILGMSWLRTASIDSETLPTLAGLVT